MMKVKEFIFVNRRISCNLKTFLTYFAVVVFLLNILGYLVGQASYRQNDLRISTTAAYILPSAQPISMHPSVFSPIQNAGIATSAFYSTRKAIPLIESNAPCKRVAGRAVNDGRWFNYTTKDAIVYAYSAFYDNRTTLLNDPVIRVIVLSPNNKFYAILPQYFCRLYFPIDGSHESGMEAKYRVVDVPMTNARPIGMGWPLNGVILREYLFSCMPPKNIKTVASGVGILVGKKSQEEVTSCVPIERPAKPIEKQDVAICVQVAYGAQNPLHLIEWIEMQRLLGVSLIGINHMEMDVDSLAILRHYARQGIVELRQMHYIPTGDQQYMLFGSPAINDCFYRNMFRFKRILVIDFDELILPRTRGTLKELFQELERNHGPNIPNFLFRNQYFFTDIPQETDQPREFKFLSYRKATKISRFGYSAKSAVQPETCIQMHNHFCWQHTPAYAKLQLTDAIPSLATNQHYRSCPLDSKACHDSYAAAQRDDSIKPFERPLLIAINATVKAIRSSLSFDPFARWKLKPLTAVNRVQGSTSLNILTLFRTTPG